MERSRSYQRAAGAMRVSIITVCFNAAGTIEETLRSVATQTYRDVEHIVVDGGSTDGTMDVIQSHRSALAHLISEPDRGIYDAMNKGLRLASGSIIGLLNADDVYAHEHVLDRVAGTMQSGGVEAVFGDVVFVERAGTGRVVRRYSSARFRPSRLAGGWMPAHPTLFLRSEVYRRFGLYRTDYRIAGDFEYVARIFSGEEIRYRYIPEVLVVMRAGGVSTSGFRSKLLLNREILRACRENGIRTNVLRVYAKYFEKVFELARTGALL